MDTQEFRYEEALTADMSAVRKVVAPTGSMSQVAEFPNLRSLDLTGNRDITSFDFLTQLPKLEKLYIAEA